MRRLPMLCLISLVGCTCEAPSQVEVTGKFTAARGLEASDYALYAPGSESPGKIGGDGTFTASVAASRAGFLMAVPREDAQLALAPESGLYLTPIAGGARLSGPSWAVTTTRPATLDATTTVVSFVLQHPMFAHPAPDVQRRQLEWVATTLSANWVAVADAATRYDAALSAAADPFADPAFLAALHQALTDAELGLPLVAPLAEGGATQQGLTGASLVTLANGTRVVTRLESVGGKALKPGTDTGTALDYLYVVRPLPAAEFPLGKDDPAFLAAEALVVRSWGAPVASGYVAASSYASYADVVGNVMKWTTKLWSTPLAPDDDLVMGAPGFYEVRFFSGALGVGTPAAEYDFAAGHFPAEARAAFIHNVTAGAFEAVSLVPGAGEVFGSEVGAQVGQEVVQQLVVDLEALLDSKGPALIEASDLYAIGFNAVKAAVDKASEKLTEDAQKSAWKQFFAWAKWGGKKAVKAVMDLPGKVARGGALAHRAARLTAPSSVMELHHALVAEASLPETLTGTEHLDPVDPNGEFTYACELTWTLSGTRPKLVASRPERGVMNYAFTVAPSEPARLVLEFNNLSVSPQVKESPPNEASTRTVFTVASVTFDPQYEQFYVSPGGTITGSSSGHTLRADFTMTPSKSDLDYSFATAYGGLVVRGTYEVFDKATGALLERHTDYPYTTASPSLGYFSVEAK